VASSFLVIISERRALAWVLSSRRMAFPAHRLREVSALTHGDELFLYTTRGCFHNPPRDRGRVIGLARASSGIWSLDPPVVVADRQFAYACDLDIESLAPLRTGVDLAALVPELATFPNKTGWTTRLRRPLLPLDKEDAALLRRKLRRFAVSPDAATGEYLAAVPGALAALG
jgi:hypothetical protein